MAENICPICGERLKDGYCSACGVSMSNSYESNYDAKSYERPDFEASEEYPEYSGEESAFSSEEDPRVINSEPAAETFKKSNPFGNDGYSRTVEHIGDTVVTKETWQKSSFSSADMTQTTVIEGGDLLDEIEAAKLASDQAMREAFEKFSEMNGGGFHTFKTSNAEDFGLEDDAPLIKLIFSKRHGWKVVLALIMPPLGFILSGLTMGISDKNIKKVGKFTMVLSLLGVALWAFLKEMNLF